jgi:hypothetical protein
MGKLFLAGAAAALVLAAAYVAIPGGASAGPKYASANGAAERTADAFAERHIAFSATNGPSGTTGEFTSHRQLAPGSGPAPVFSFTGDVTCLRVDGNRAVIGGVIRHSFFAENEGKQFFVAVEDNGNPASGASPDRVSAYGLGDDVAGLTCDDVTDLYATLAPVESGNIRVGG